MGCIKSISISIYMSIIVILIADFTLTNFGLSSIKPSASLVIGTDHPVYHHDLRAKIEGKVLWSNLQYHFSAHAHDFKKDSMIEDSIATIPYSLAVINDSFIEVVTMEYPDSFMGLYAATYPELHITIFMLLPFLIFLTLMTSFSGIPLILNQKLLSIDILLLLQLFLHRQKNRRFFSLFSRVNATISHMLASFSENCIPLEDLLLYNNGHEAPCATL